MVVMMKSALTALSTVESRESVNDRAIVLKAPTSARPIISARPSAQSAAGCGGRCRRPGDPMVPRKGDAEEPDERPGDRRGDDDRRADGEQEGEGHEQELVETLAADKPSRRAPARVSTATPMPMKVRRAEALRRRDEVVAHGGHRWDARRPEGRQCAGDERRPDPDASRATMTVRSEMTSEPENSKPMAPNRAAVRSRATPPEDPQHGPDQPDDEGLQDHAAAHLLREAPSARNRASSRVRWATSIANVLKIRNSPTTTDTKAKKSRA